MIIIKELEIEKLEDFFEYLTIHISENSQNSTYLYFPLSKEQSTLSDELKIKFKEGMSKEMGEKGWRKAWVALNKSEIVGHIDIRSNNILNSEHRVLLGIGVDINFRGLNIGQKLLEFVIEFCKTNNKISWIDLEVMSNNKPAKKLYEKVGFQQIYEIKDMFRIDNKSFNQTFMTKNVEN